MLKSINRVVFFGVVVALASVFFTGSVYAQAPCEYQQKLDVLKVDSSGESNHVTVSPPTQGNPDTCPYIKTIILNGRLSPAGADVEWHIKHHTSGKEFTGKYNPNGTTITIPAGVCIACASRLEIWITGKPPATITDGLITVKCGACR